MIMDDVIFLIKISVPYLQNKNAVLEAEDQQQVDDEYDQWDFLSIDCIAAVAPDSGS